MWFEPEPSPLWVCPRVDYLSGRVFARKSAHRRRDRPLTRLRRTPANPEELEVRNLAHDTVEYKTPVSLFKGRPLEQAPVLAEEDLVPINLRPTEDLVPWERRLRRLRTGWDRQRWRPVADGFGPGGISKPATQVLNQKRGSVLDRADGDDEPPPAEYDEDEEYWDEEDEEEASERLALKLSVFEAWRELAEERAERLEETAAQRERTLRRAGLLQEEGDARDARAAGPSGAATSAATAKPRPPRSVRRYARALLHLALAPAVRARRAADRTAQTLRSHAAEAREAFLEATGRKVKRKRRAPGGPGGLPGGNSSDSDTDDDEGDDDGQDADGPKGQSAAVIRKARAKGGDSSIRTILLDRLEGRKRKRREVRARAACLPSRHAACCCPPPPLLHCCH